jgi:aldehyde dehydrogenase (NAD+)
MTFRTPDEAVERANNTLYGLSAGIWTDKGSKIFKMASKLRAGCRVGEHVQQVRPDEPLRRLQGKRLRP